MMNSVSMANGYVNRHKIVRYEGDPKRLNKDYDLQQLKQKCLEIGVDDSGNNKIMIIKRLCESEMFARTPSIPAQIMASLIPGHKQSNHNFKKLKVLELFAGNGNITKYIDDRHEITCVEIDKFRAESGKYWVPNARWLNYDIFDEEFMNKYVIDGMFDVVIMNSDFRYIMAASLLALAA